MSQTEKERIAKNAKRLLWILDYFLTPLWLTLLVVSIVAMWAGSDLLYWTGTAYLFVSLAGFVLIIIQARCYKKLKTLNQEKGGNQ